MKAYAVGILMELVLPNVFFGKGTIGLPWKDIVRNM